MLFNSVRILNSRYRKKCLQLYSIDEDGYSAGVSLDILKALRESGFDAVSYVAMGEISTYVFITPTEMPALEEQSKILSFGIAKSPVDKFLARMIAKHPAAF